MGWDRATVVHPRSLEIFESLGIVDRLLASGVKQTGARLHAGGELLGEIDLVAVRQPLSVQHRHLGRGHRSDPDRLSRSAAAATVTRARSSWSTGGPGGRRRRDDRARRRGEHDLGRLGGRVRRAPQHGADAGGIELDGHDIGEPWAVFDATLAGLAGLLRGELRLSGRDPGHPHRPAGQAVAGLPAAEFAGSPTWWPTPLLTLRRYLPEARFDDVANPTRFIATTKVAEQFRAGPHPAGRRRGAHLLPRAGPRHEQRPAGRLQPGLEAGAGLPGPLLRGRLLDSYEAERRPVAELVTASGDAAEQRPDRGRRRGQRRARDAAIRAAFADPADAAPRGGRRGGTRHRLRGSPIVMGDRNEAHLARAAAAGLDRGQVEVGARRHAARIRPTPGAYGHPDRRRIDDAGTTRTRVAPPEASGGRSYRGNGGRHRGQ